jgi:hypothetical protein
MHRLHELVRANTKGLRDALVVVDVPMGTLHAAVPYAAAARHRLWLYPTSAAFDSVAFA